MILKRIVAGTLTLIMTASSFAVSDNIIGNKSIENTISANAWYENIEKDFLYRIGNNDTIDIGRYDGEKENPVIPYMIEGKVVTEISGWGEAWEGAFERCNIKSVTIPASVKSVNKYIFGDPKVGFELSKNVKINCYADSAAEKFAKENGYDYYIIPHEKHTYVKTMKLPTFFKGGYTIYQCEDCGHWYRTNEESKLVLKNVTGFKVAASSANAIKLKWNDMYQHWNKETHADGYIIYRYNTKTKKYVRIAKVGMNSNTYTDKKLASGTSYKYAIRAYKIEDGKEVLSPKYPQITTSTNPAAVNFKLTAGSKKATIKWSKVTGATGYKVYYKTSKNGKWIGLKTTNNKTTSYSKSGLTKGKTYYFTVKAYRTVGGKTYNGAFTSKSIKVK